MPHSQCTCTCRPMSLYERCRIPYENKKHLVYVGARGNSRTQGRRKSDPLPAAAGHIMTACYGVLIEVAAHFSSVVHPRASQSERSTTFLGDHRQIDRLQLLRRVAAHAAPSGNVIPHRPPWHYHATVAFDVHDRYWCANCFSPCSWTYGLSRKSRRAAIAMTTVVPSIP